MTNGSRDGFLVSMSPSHEKLQAAKTALRKRMRVVRDVLNSSEAAGEACRHAFDALADGPEPVAGYWPIGSELDPRALLQHLAQAGRVVVLPVSDPPGMPLRFRRWIPGMALRRGRYGIAEPDESCPELSPAALLIPLLAFDRRGYRLGYGGGYYDRTLALLRNRGPVRAIGFALAGLEVPEVPHDSYDCRLDAVVREVGLLGFEEKDCG